MWAGLFGVGAALVLVAQLVPPGVPRAVLALPPVLLLPGYALLGLVFDRRRPDEPATVLVFSVGLSLAVLMADALVLNGLGIRLTTPALGLAALGATAALAGAATARRRTRAGDEPRWSRPATPVRWVALAVSLAAALALVGVVAGRLPSPPSRPFSTLSLGPGWATRGTAPVVRTGQRVEIPVVASTSSPVPGRYRLSTAVDATVRHTQLLSLSRSADWRGDVGVVAPDGPGLHRVVIDLDPVSGPAHVTANQVIVYLHHDAS